MKYIASFISVITLSACSTFALANQPVSNTVLPAQAVVDVKQDLININTADVLELTKLKGIGVKKAEAIVAWRTANGDFKSVDQLLEVKGIGEATLMQNRENIRI